MKDMELMSMASAHFFCILSVILSALIPPLVLEKFSVLGTHLTWLCICSTCVAAVNITVYIVLKPNPSPKRNSVSHRVSRFLKSCLYFLISCLLFHGITVLYGAPLVEAMSIWDSSLQITTVCSIVGAWFGAFPIPLDWDRPWCGLFPVRLELPLAMWLVSLLHHYGYTGTGSTSHTKANNWSREKRDVSLCRFQEGCAEMATVEADYPHPCVKY
ncbi:phosphatidylinositol-glycan biosynthesis class F protein isoform X3 [Rhinatrema bivittatum]|uniref:phosphatidylinositol-glycan biosynthesis class F protein isoform X3 n=1 Tax=Rhinatrema bivittatum TaxID=194408 RepID=UPI00112DADD9|nr:phosphatidylinositol-glycan biosynthesis class F protein isoform X3 [Rhinatrema bivittatum]